MNKILVLGIIFILMFSVGVSLGSSHANLIHSVVIPSGIVKQFEINVSNNQSIATPNPIQVPIKINKTYYSSYLVYNGSFANFEFYYVNGTIIPAWIESSNTTTILVWLKLYSISADSTVNIYLGFASATTNLLNNTGKNGIGEAPELSNTYGKYDDGSMVFNFYDNFAGTSLNISKWSVNGITYKVNNGFFATSSGASSDGIWSSLVSYSPSVILDFYGDPYQSSTFWAESGFVTNTTSNNDGTFIQSYYGAIFGQQQYSVSSSSNSNDLATSNVSNQVWSIIWKNSTTTDYQLNYGNTQVVNKDGPSPPLHIGLVKADSGSFSNTYFIQWIRVRAYPPNGVMPIVNIPGEPLTQISQSSSNIVHVLTENITTPFILSSVTLGNYPGLIGPIISKYVPSGDLTEFFAPENISHTLIIKNLVTGSVQYINNFYDIGTEDNHFFPNIAPFQMANGNILDIYSVGANNSGDPLTVYVYFINNNTLVHRSWAISSTTTSGLTENSIFVQISNSWFMGDLLPSSTGSMQIMAFNIFSGQVINSSIQLPTSSDWNSLSYLPGTNQSIFQINVPSNHTLYNLIQWLSYQGNLIEINYRVIWFYSPLIVGYDYNNMPYFEKKLSNGTYLTSLPGSESATNNYYFNSFMYVYPNNPYKDVMFNIVNMSENGVPDIFTGTFITQSGYQVGGSNDYLYSSSDDPYQTGFFNWFNSSNIITNITWFNSLYEHQYAYGYIGHGTPAFTPYSAYFGYFGRENGIIPYNSNILSLAYFSGTNPTVSNITYSVVNNNPQSELYSVTFQESGLPSGTIWSLTFNSNSYSSNSSKIVIKEPNGTYSFNINSIGYYQPSPSSGSITVNGNNIYENITFTKVISYQITFIENGLVSGITWQITLDSTIKSSTSSSIVFNELQNGTYFYSVSIFNKWYSYSPASGTLTVNGANLTQDIQFTQLFAITFIASGLSSGTIWSLTLNSNTYSSNSNSIVISYLSPDSYSFYVNNINGYSINPQSGTISLANQNITEYVQFVFDQVTSYGNNNNGNVYYNQPIVSFNIAESFVIYLIIGIFIMFIIFGAIASVKRR